LAKGELEEAELKGVEDKDDELQTKGSVAAENNVTRRIRWCCGRQTCACRVFEP